MSNVVFPSLPGLSITLPMRPAFRTGIKASVSGMEARAAFMAYPLWTLGLKFEVLRHGAENELRQIMGFFLARRGSFDSFLFTHPDDNAVTGEAIGTGNGTQTQFQLARTLGYGAGMTFTEPVHNYAGASPSIYVDGVLKTVVTDYSINSTGLVTFVNPVSSGKVVTWSGSYYYRCRFDKDEAEFERFLQDLYDLKRLDLVGSVVNKVGP